MLSSILRKHSQFKSPKIISNSNKRACVAIIFRIGGHFDPHKKRMKFDSREELLEFLENFPGKGEEQELDSSNHVHSRYVDNQDKFYNNCEVLFIQRAFNPKDKWSNHVAFPGGRVQENDPDLYSCAVREVQEEIGIDLRNDANFLYIGQLDDQVASRPKPRLHIPFLKSKGRDQVQGFKEEKLGGPLNHAESTDNSLIISTFLFVQLDYSEEKTTKFTLAPSEVQSVFWVPTTTITKSILNKRPNLKMSLKELKLNDKIIFLLRLCGCKHFYFPCISLNPTEIFFMSSISKNSSYRENNKKDIIESQALKEEQTTNKNKGKIKEKKSLYLPLWGLSLRLVDHLQKKLKDHVCQDKEGSEILKSKSRNRTLLDIFNLGSFLHKTSPNRRNKLPFHTDSPLINFILQFFY